jgi:hypothetical protein
MLLASKFAAAAMSVSSKAVDTCYSATKLGGIRTLHVHIALIFFLLANRSGDRVAILKAPFFKQNLAMLGIFLPIIPVCITTNRSSEELEL